MDRVWVGVDVGKEHHWAVVLDSQGQVRLSRKIATRTINRLRQHRPARVILSLPGMGFRLGAELLATVGDLTSFASADHLAAGKRSKTALIALARRRLNVLWAMLRGHRPYQPAAQAITAPAA